MELKEKLKDKWINMTQMEEIEKLYAKSKDYTVPKEPKEGQKQVTLTVNQLSLEDMSVMDIKENAPVNEIAKSAITMISKSLGITEEAASKISFQHMEDIMAAIMDINDFKEVDKTGVNKINDFIKSKSEQAKVNKANELTT